MRCQAWYVHSAGCAGRPSALCELKEEAGRLVAHTAARGDGASCFRASGTKAAAQQGLRPLAFKPVQLGTVRPEGWLRSQLIVMANGLSGHLDLFWPDVMESVSIGN